MIKPTGEEGPVFIPVEDENSINREESPVPPPVEDPVENEPPIDGGAAPEVPAVEEDPVENEDPTNQEEPTVPPPAEEGEVFVPMAEDDPEVQEDLPSSLFDPSLYPEWTGQGPDVSPRSPAGPRDSAKLHDVVDDIEIDEDSEAEEVEQEPVEEESVAEKPVGENPVNEGLVEEDEESGEEAEVPQAFDYFLDDEEDPEAEDPAPPPPPPASPAPIVPAPPASPPAGSTPGTCGADGGQTKAGTPCKRKAPWGGGTLPSASLVLRRVLFQFVFLNAEASYRPRVSSSQSFLCSLQSIIVSAKYAGSSLRS